MSTTRLTFLYPHLFRSIRTAEPVVRTIRTRAPAPQRQCCQTRGLSTSVRREHRHARRHGKAVQPMIHEEASPEDLKVFAPGVEGKDSAKSAEPKDQTIEEEIKDEEGDEQELAFPPDEPLSEETQAAAILPGDDASSVGQDAEKSEVTPIEQATINTKEPLAPLETVLQMPPPETPEEENAAKPPHLQTPPYVHHFDTYTLVQQVEAGGFTAAQSITAMKAVRGLLAINLDVAKAGLVSKSDVENETYLFRAACSELKVEIQNGRRKSEETMRRERTLLQHEVDILNQKLTQELLTLKDELKGMFDDRKMAVREEQRSMESKIQELNYKITVLLNSDSKSEVEGLRWVLTRRSVMGILFMAFMVLTSLRYASYKAHEDELRKKKEAGSNNKKEEIIEDLPAQGAAEILAAN